MPRPRKYDYQNDYPVKLWIKVPINIVNSLEKLGYSQSEIQKLVENEKVVEEYLLDFIKSIGK